MYKAQVPMISGEATDAQHICKTWWFVSTKTLQSEEYLSSIPVDSKVVWNA